MRTISVDVNVMNQMKNTIEFFSDRLCFVDEAFQNAQRSGAKNLRVQVETDHIVVEDDGCGCDDLEVLFVQSLSGWGREIQESDNPFGIGFFASICAAKLISVESKGKMAIFDVEKMFAEERLDVVEEVDCDFKGGFRLRLENLHKDVNKYDVISRAENLSTYMDFNTEVNNRLQIRRDYFEYSSNEDLKQFSRVIDDEFAKGRVWPIMFSWHSINLHYQNRYVSDSETNYMGGQLLVLDKNVKPRCPDRKEFIDDDGYKDFENRLQDIGMDIALQLVNEKPDLIDNYLEFVNHFLHINQYKKHIKFGSIEGFEAVYAQMEMVDAIPIDELPPKIRDEMLKLPKEKGKYNYEEIEKMPLFIYGTASDMMSNIFKVNKLREAGLTFIISRNYNDSSILQRMENGQCIRNLGTIKTHLVGCAEEPKDNREQRFIDMFYKVLRDCLGFQTPEDLVKIGNFHREIKVPISGITNTQVDFQICVYKAKIYINRLGIDWSIIEDEIGDFTKADLKWMVQNMWLVSHELSHLLFGTRDQTLEHDQATKKLCEKIGGWLVDEYSY